MERMAAKKIKTIIPFSSCFCLLVSVAYVLTQLGYNHVVVQNPTLEGTGTRILLIIAAIIISFFLSIAIEKMYSRMDSANAEDDIHYSLATGTVLLLIFWVPYLIFRFPGNYDPDTLWQLMEPYGLCDLSDHHPFFDTMVFYVFWKIGDALGSNLISVLLYAVIQMVLTAGTFSLATKYIAVNTRNQGLIKLAFIFFAFYPVIPLFSQTMAKDMLHGWVYILFYIGAVKCIQTQGGFLKSPKNFAISILVCLLLFMTKKTGFYVAIITMFFALLSCKKARIQLCGLMAAVIMLFFSYENCLLPALGVRGGKSGEMMSIPSQQTALYIRSFNEEMGDEDWDVLNGVFNDPQGMADVYNPVRADNTKGHWKSDADAGSVIRYVKWYLQKLGKHPGTFLNGLLVNDNSMFVIDTNSAGDESLIYYRDNIPLEGTSRFEEILASWSNGKTAEDVNQLVSSSYRPAWAYYLASIFNTVYYGFINIFSILFSKALVATWIPLFVLFYLFRARNWKGILCMVPAILTSCVLAVGPIVLPRYMVNSVYELPIVFTIPFLRAKGSNE